MPCRFEDTRDTPSGMHDVSELLKVPIVEHEAFDQPRLMLDTASKPWFIALPTWWFKPN